MPRFKIYRQHLVPNQSMQHRGRLLDYSVYKANDDGWTINDVERCIVRFHGEPGWWIVSAYSHQEDDALDDGPYRTKVAAAIVATFQEES